MSRVLLSVHGAVWGMPMLVLILGTGFWITGKTRSIQFRLLPAAIQQLFCKLRVSGDSAEASSFRALCTALGATVGTGNIIGVAGAICLGGPGAVFWMWVCGFAAMATKFAEAVLAVYYRRQSENTYLGGPMYMILDGLGSRWHVLATIYSVLGILACLGVGNTVQVNAVISGINDILLRFGTGESLHRNFAVGLILSVILGSVLMGGCKRIGRAAEILVPAASLGYILLCTVILLLRRQYIGNAVCSILQGAFAPDAVTGGVVGSAFQSLRIGCCRGVFTNEAGMGTAAMAHAAADVKHPVEQGLMGIVEVFVDTIVLCTLTALVILVSGITVPYGSDAGSMLTFSAFSSVCGDWAAFFLAAAMICFAVATVLGWGLYGTRCVQFLFGDRACEPFAVLQTAAVVLGACVEAKTAWLLAELFNGLMAIPNLIALAVLTPELCRLTEEYINKTGGSAAEGGNHADFNQCQPLRTFSYEKIPSLRGCGGKGRKEDLSSEYRSA